MIALAYAYLIIMAVLGLAALLEMAVEEALRRPPIKPSDHTCANERGGRRCDVCFGPIAGQ